MESFEPTKSYWDPLLTRDTGAFRVASFVAGWVLAILAMLTGCASNRADLERARSEIQHGGSFVEIRTLPRHVTAGYGTFLASSGPQGAVKGFAEGFAFGVLYPPSWMVGGPIFMAPLGSYLSAKCSRELSPVEDPIGQLQRHAEEVGLSPFTVELVSRMARFEARSPPTDPGRHRSDYRLEIKEVSIKLAADSSSCARRLSGTAEWSLVRQADGQHLAGRDSKCESVATDQSLVDWFAAPEGIRAEISGLFSALAEKVVDDAVLGPSSRNYCRRSKDGSD